MGRIVESTIKGTETAKSLSLDLFKKHLQEESKAVILLWDIADLYKRLPALFYLIVWFL